MPWIEPSESRPLTFEEMQENAKMVWAYFQTVGWTLNAVCGMLGNMQSESSINPTRWQSDIPGEGGGGGYGLVQWTPWTNLIGRAEGIGVNWQTGSGQVQVINWEFNNGIQYYPTTAYPMTANEFKVSTLTPRYLAMVFINNYERPLDPDQPGRGDQAEYWYEFLSGEPPEPPFPEYTKNKFPWFLFM